MNTGIYNSGDIYVKNADTAFAYSSNNGDDVSYTFNGGKNWTHFLNGTFNGAGISAIHFPLVNSSVGYAVTSWGGKIFKTINGGKTWEQIAQPTSQGFKDVYFTTTNTGYALGLAFILKTTDAGIHWTAINSNTGGEKMEIIGNNMYINDGSNILVSNDDGANFTAMTGPITSILNFQMLSPSEGYLVGGEGSIYKLQESTAVKSKTRSKLFKLYPNPSNGLIFIEKLELGGSDVNLTILNTYGQEVYNTSLNQSTKSIDLSSLNLKGNYFLKMSDDKNRYDIEMVIIH